MRHRRPPRLKNFSYKGQHRYFVTCTTFEHGKHFDGPTIVTICAEQILRTCKERDFRVIAYSFMEDHLHLVIRGEREESDFKATMKLMRQRTAFAHSQAHHRRLWHDGYFDRVLRPGDDVFSVIRYILDNPKAAGLPAERCAYPYVWSDPDAKA